MALGQIDFMERSKWYSKIYPLGGYIALLYNRTSCFTIQVNQLSVKYESCSKRNTSVAFQKYKSANTLHWNLTSTWIRCGTSYFHFLFCFWITSVSHFTPTGIRCGRNPFTLACLCLLLQVLIHQHNDHDHFVLKLWLLGSVLVQILKLS